MTKINRQTQLGLGVEATAGTLATADDWFTPDEVDPVEITEHAVDNGALGNLANAVNGRKTKKMTEINFGGFLGDRLIGYLLLGAFGTAGSATLVETSVYSHAFTENNTNAKPSFSIYLKDTDQAEVAKYCMLNTLELNFVAGQKAKYKAQFMGQNLVDQAGTQSLSAEKPLDTHDLSLEYDASYANLGSGTSFNIKELNLLFENNVVDYMANGSAVPNKMFNQTFRISGDFTLVYDADTWRDFNLNDTKKALRIHVENQDTLIGATEYPSLTIDLARIGLVNWETERALDEIVMQKISFEAEYSITDSLMAVASLVNTKATKYE